MACWTDRHAPRIWRCPDSDFYGDEPMHAAEVYTPDVLKDIKAHGFNAIWLRGKLYELMQSTVIPELNHAGAAKRCDHLRQVIRRGRTEGVEVFLYLNEPLGLPADHPMWNARPQLRGAMHCQPLDHETTYAMCTSEPLTKVFLQQAIESLLDALPGLAGVILITASEFHSHCWSHTQRYTLNDGIHDQWQTIPDCPRCSKREPSRIVCELLKIWADAVRAKSANCRVLAWNWSWSMWYADPQAEIVSLLPEGVGLLADWERGDQQMRNGCEVQIDEYSLSFRGPSQRFLRTTRCAAAHTSVYAKLQIGTTHELATVPNLPLMENLHAKFVGLTEQGIAGTMACWNFGCSLTLNTYAMKCYVRDPGKSADANVFLQTVCGEYFGDTDVERVLHAWRIFSRAFEKYYPFALAFLYRSPVNDAPAHPLSLHYRAQALGPSWLEHDMGDDAMTCAGPFTLPQISTDLSLLVTQWQAGIVDYAAALSDGRPGSVEHQKHRTEELSCAQMIGLQLASAANFFRFHQRRIELIGTDNAPRVLPRDEKLVAIMQEEIDNACLAVPLVKADARLGLHQESHVLMYDAMSIEAKIDQMKREIRGV